MEALYKVEKVAKKTKIVANMKVEEKKKQQAEVAAKIT